MQFSAPPGVSDVSFGGVDYPASNGLVIVPDGQATPALIAAFAIAGVTVALQSRPAQLPTWTTASRPLPADGVAVIGYNTTTSQLELGVTGSGQTSWTPLVGGAAVSTPVFTAAPVSIVLPLITGTAVQGSVLTATAGLWSGTPTPTYAYQWQRAGVAIAGATANTYTLVSADVGNAITVSVTASNSAGVVSALSIATALITALVGNTAPVNAAVPTISGIAQQGQTLTATSGTWSGNPTPTYAYQWNRAGTPIAGATSSTYTLVSGDVSNTITVTVTASNSAGSASATSAATATITGQVTSTRARFAQDTATAGTSGTAAALFASMTQVSGASSDRTGTLTTTADGTKYTWVAVLASAAGAGMHFFDGTGFGGFNGAASSSIYGGADADPTTIHQTYTDGSGNVWNLYRSSGHSVALTFTLS